MWSYVFSVLNEIICSGCLGKGMHSQPLTEGLHVPIIVLRRSYSE